MNFIKYLQTRSKFTASGQKYQNDMPIFAMGKERLEALNLLIGSQVIEPPDHNPTPWIKRFYDSTREGIIDLFIPSLLSS